MSRRGCLALVVVGAMAGRAHADDPPHVRSALLEGGMAYGAGAREAIGVVHGFLGVTAEPVDRHVHGGRVFGVIGGRLEYGSVVSEHTTLEPSSVDQTMLEAVPVGALRWTVSPELRVGARWARKSWPVYTYVGVGPMWSKAWGKGADARWIPELGERRGVRGAVGGAIGFVHVELTFEHIAGADRAAFGLGAAFN